MFRRRLSSIDQVHEEEEDHQERKAKIQVVWPEIPDANSQAESEQPSEGWDLSDIVMKESLHGRARDALLHEELQVLVSHHEHGCCGVQFCLGDVLVTKFISNLVQPLHKYNSPRRNSSIAFLTLMLKILPFGISTCGEE